MILTFDFDLQIYPPTWLPYQNSSLYICLFSYESGNRQTDPHKNTVFMVIDMGIKKSMQNTPHRRMMCYKENPW